MKLTKAEYEAMILKRPSLKPTEVIKKAAIAFGEYHEKLPLKDREKIARKLAQSSPWIDFLVNNPKDVCVTQVIKDQEKCVKSPRTLKFTILGQPVGKPRQTQSDRWKKRPCVMRYRAWADKARASVPKGVELGVYRQISFIAYLELPKSYSEAKKGLLRGQPHLGRIDGDNILKAIQDSLFKEDRMIWKFSGEKRWDDMNGPRIEVELR